MNNQCQTAAIVGAGLIGRAWANVFARAGWNVRVWDPSPAQRVAAQRDLGAAANGFHPVDGRECPGSKTQLTPGWGA